MDIYKDILIIMILFALLINYHYLTKTETIHKTKTIHKTINKIMKEAPVLSLKDKVYTDILKRTKDALDFLNIKFFLSSGTCLGYYRENKFIEHDYDIDVGIFKEDYTPKIIEMMKKQGFHHYRTLGNVKTGLELSFRLLGTPLGKAAKIDIFLHYKNGDKISWQSYKAPKFKVPVKYQVPKFTIKKVKFMNLDVYVPYPTIKYIEHHYGKKWYIPNKPKWLGGTYSYKSSPESIVK
jgi:hypothetical protein